MDEEVFDNMRLCTKGSVYFPREDSELAAHIVKMALANMNDGVKILDMGCGTGYLGIAAMRSPKVSSVCFADINPDAIECAKMNVTRNNPRNVQTSFVVSDLFSNVSGKFDIVMFNAPYLPDPSKDEITMNKEHEIALSGGKDGIELSMRFIDGLSQHIEENSMVVLVGSTASNKDKLLNHITESGFGYSVEATRKFFFEEIFVLAIWKTKA